MGPTRDLLRASSHQRRALSDSFRNETSASASDVHPRYDPIAMLAAVPSLSSHFVFDETQVNGVTHRVVGSSPEHTGIADGPKLAQYMTAAFMHGISVEQQRKEREREMVASLFHSLALSKYTVAQLKAHIHRMEQERQQQGKSKKIPIAPKRSFFFGIETTKGRAEEGSHRKRETAPPAAAPAAAPSLFSVPSAPAPAAPPAIAPTSSGC